MIGAAQDDARKLTVRRTAIGVAGVGLCFSLFVMVEMFLVWGQLEEARPIDHPHLVALRADLALDPGAATITAEIRREEAALRARFHTADMQLRRGGWLLLLGVVTFAAATKLALATRPRRPILVERDLAFDPDRGMSVFGRVGVAGLAVLLAGTAVTIPVLYEESTEIETAHGMWARFRGPGGRGISPYADVPLTFDGREDAATNLRWKALVPLPGLSSPVVWNDRVFLTGASPNTREVYCFDALSGALLWRKPVSAGPESSQIPENIWEETGYAAPSAVTDGAHVWSLFANGDVVCHDFFGKEAWCVNLGLPVNMYGIAASPVLFGNQLVLQIDQDWGDDAPRSALIALDPATGTERWRTPREVESSWPTPIPIETASGVQILTCANPFVIAYDPADGTEIWRAECLGGDGGPSPTAAAGMVLVVNIGSPLTALRTDGAGDVTQSHTVWSFEEDLPDVCSLLASDELVWMQSTDGRTTCLDVLTGEVQYTHDHDASYYMSPAMAGERIYLLSRAGALTVIGTGREYQELGRGDLGEECDSSPSFAEGRIYVRGHRHLFCFAEGAE